MRLSFWKVVFMNAATILWKSDNSEYLYNALTLNQVAFVKTRSLQDSLRGFLLNVGLVTMLVKLQFRQTFFERKSSTPTLKSARNNKLAQTIVFMVISSLICKRIYI